MTTPSARRLDTSPTHHVARASRPFAKLCSHSSVCWSGCSWCNRVLTLAISLLNTNVDGKRKIQYALTEIKGVGRRYANIVCKKADIDLTKRYVCLWVFRYACWRLRFGDSASKEQVTGRFPKEMCFSTVLSKAHMHARSAKCH